MTNPRKPFFTIAITTYNRADSYLRETLESALAQTHDDLEILVSDNGSTDNTSELVASYDDPRLRYYQHPKNIAPRDHFRFCIEEAKGQYVLILHDDDTLKPTFIETCAKHAAGSDKFGLIRTGVNLMDIESNFLEKHPNLSTGESASDFMIEWCHGKSPLYYCNVMYNKDLMIEVGSFFSKTNYYLDLASDFRLAAKYPRLEIKEELANFRVGNASLGTMEKLDARIDESKYIVNLMVELMPENSKLLRKEANKFFSNRMLRYADELPNPLLTKVKHYRWIIKEFEQNKSWVFIFRRLRRKMKQP